MLSSSLLLLVLVEEQANAGGIPPVVLHMSRRVEQGRALELRKFVVVLGLAFY